MVNKLIINIKIKYINYIYKVKKLTKYINKILGIKAN